MSDDARRAFDAATAHVESLGDDDLRRTHAGTGRPIGGFVLTCPAHDDVRRGQIPALRRAQGLPRVRA